MKRRQVIFAVLLIISVLVGTQVIGVASANPFGLAKQMDAPSDAKPPIISINSPQNSTDYSGTFNISFSVKQPRYFKSTVIANIWYTIDNTTVSIPYEHWTLTQGPGISQYNTSITAPTLPAGNHSLKIRAQGGSYDFNNFFLIDGYSQVYFTISENNGQTNHSNQTNNPTATPTQTLYPSPSEASFPTVSPTVTYLLANSTFLIAIAVVIVIVAFASISLFYFKRRNTHEKN
jgi:hypothetical protein